MTAVTAPAASAAAPDRSHVGRMLFFFGLAYFAQGFAQDTGVLYQPLRHYLLHGLHWSVDRMSAYLALLVIPWLIKPLYGLVTDLLPIRGRQRRPYLLLTSALAALGYLAACGLTEPEVLLWALMVTSVNTAFADVVTDAVMVTEGQKWNMVRVFQGVQWTWLYVAGILAATVGGVLAGRVGPEGGVRAAAALAALCPLAFLVASWALVKEDPAPPPAGFRQAVAPLVTGFRTPQLWFAAVFMLFWNCMPGFGDPLYAHMSDRLHFTQTFIGNLGAIGNAGFALGAWMFERFLARRFSTRTLVIWTIPLGALSSIIYLGMVDGITAGVVHFVSGAITMVATLVALGLAGEACPPRGAGFCFAALMSVSNGSTRISMLGGAFLYERVVGKSLTPLIWINALTTLLLFALLPLVNRIVRESEGAREAEPSGDGEPAAG